MIVAVANTKKVRKMNTDCILSARFFSVFNINHKTQAAKDEFNIKILHHHFFKDKLFTLPPILKKRPQSTASSSSQSNLNFGIEKNRISSQHSFKIPINLFTQKFDKNAFTFNSNILDKVVERKDLSVLQCLQKSPLSVETQEQFIYVN